MASLRWLAFHQDQPPSPRVDAEEGLVMFPAGDSIFYLRRSCTIGYSPEMWLMHVCLASMENRNLSRVQTDSVVQCVSKVPSPKSTL